MRANKCEIEGGWSLTQGFSVDHFVNGDIECGPNQAAGHGLIQYDRENNAVSYIGADGKECSKSVGPIESGMVVTIRDSKDLGWIRFTVGRLPKQTGIAKLNFFYHDKAEQTDESNEQYLDLIFQREPYMAQCAGFREFLLESMEEIGARPRASECASMLRAFRSGSEYQQAIKRTAMDVVRALGSMVIDAGLPFTYADDICQIGEHDVCFSGIELTKDIGEFKVGQKFDGASIDFQGGHLTLETRAGREHRYDFVLKVGAKHEGHTCSGCGILAGKLCSHHAGS